MSKPVDLVIQNKLHEVAAQLLKLPPALAAGVKTDDFREELARRLLCEIAHEAHASKIFAALAAVGGPSYLQEVGHRLQAVLDAQRAESGPAPSPAAPAAREPAEGSQS